MESGAHELYPSSDRHPSPFTSREKQGFSPAQRKPGSDSEVLRSLIEGTVRYFVSREVPVYLEGFGIIFTKISQAEKSYLWGDRLVVRRERARTILFEKCYNLSLYHRERFAGIIDSRELGARVYALLPIRLAVLFGEREIRDEITALVSQLNHEVIEQGYSKILRSLGTFYSLHNRQGEKFDDWFAGADIFLQSTYEEPLSVGPCKTYPRPVLENAWELLGAALGAPLAVFTVDAAEQLQTLGYDVSALPKDAESRFQVSVFQCESPDRKSSFLLYCSDGLRKLGLKNANGKGYGTELVFQLPIKGRIEEGSERSGEGIPMWPARPLTMAWILLHGAKSKTLRPGVRHTEGVSLVPGFDTDLRSILVGVFHRVREEQLSKEGPFFYMNVMGITDDEAALAEEYGANHLFALLEQRGLGQHTKPTRSSVLARSCFAPKRNKEKVRHVLHDPRVTLPSPAPVHASA